MRATRATPSGVGVWLARRTRAYSANFSWLSRHFSERSRLLLPGASRTPFVAFLHINFRNSIILRARREEDRRPVNHALVQGGRATSGGIVSTVKNTEIVVRPVVVSLRKLSYAAMWFSSVED